MRSAEDEAADADGRSGRRARRWRGRAAVIAVLAVVAVAFVRGTRSELRYQNDPAGRPPLDQAALDALAGDRSGTSCGGWSPLLSTTERPVVAPLHAAVWADANAFHVRSDHFYVQGVRFDVEEGTAVSEGLDASASLTVPTRSGQTIDAEISCGATAVTIHLVGGDGKDVADAVLALGTQDGSPGPLRLAKEADGPTPAACHDLVGVEGSVSGALTGANRAEALGEVVAVARSARAAVADQLTPEERADADALIASLEERQAAVEAGDPDGDRPIEPAEERAAAGVIRAFDRLCR